MESDSTSYLTDGEDSLESHVKVEENFECSSQTQPSPKGIVCSCIVCCLIKQQHQRTLILKEQIDLVQLGRPKPALQNMLSVIKTGKRHFNMETYDQYEWITGCEKRSRLFCWPCLIFASEPNVFNRKGYSDLNNIHKILKKHYWKRSHLKAVIQEKLIERAHSMVEQSDTVKVKIDHQQHNNLVTENRETLKRLIDVICFLGERDIGSMGHQNFQDLVSFLSKYDISLKTYLNQSDTFLTTSAFTQIRNDLVSAIGKVIFKKIRTEIKEASFVAIRLEQSTDKVYQSQVAIVLRYLNRDGNIQERFLDFVNVTENLLAESLHETICDIIRNLDAGEKLIAQSYSGEFFFAGQSRGLQDKVKESYLKALFVLCFTDQLFLVLSQSLSHIPECKRFFSTTSGIISFFSNCTNHTITLNLLIQRRLHKIIEADWNYNGKTILTIYEHRQHLIELFESILDNCNNWDNETLNNAKSYLDCLKEDLSFNFLLHVFSEIFPCTDNLLNILQNTRADIAKKLYQIKIIIRHKKSGIDRFWDNVNKIAEDNFMPERKRFHSDCAEDFRTSYSALLNKVLDHMYETVCYIQDNFSTKFKFLELCDMTKTKLLPERAFESLVDHYGAHFDTTALRVQISVIYESEDIILKSNPHDLLNFLKQVELEKSFSEVVKFCELMLTIPIGSVSDEDGFSVWQRINMFVENSTMKDRLSKLPVLFIEKDFVKDMCGYPSFYDDVISEFAEKNKTISLNYK